MTGAEYSSVTEADYRWFEERFAWWAEAYCFTLVASCAPVDLLALLGAETAGERCGLAELADRSMDRWADTGGAELVVGMVDAGGGWSLMAEVNGYVGMARDLVHPVAARHEVVSHYRNVNGVDRFVWWRGGAVELEFEPLFVSVRSGARPDGILPALRAVGLAVDEPDHDVAHTAATFALAERVTGVRLTPEFLSAAEYLVGSVAMPTSRSGS